jgi:hypothetical protein
MVPPGSIVHIDTNERVIPTRTSSVPRVLKAVMAALAGGSNRDRRAAFVLLSVSPYWER